MQHASELSGVQLLVVHHGDLFEGETKVAVGGGVDLTVVATGVTAGAQPDAEIELAGFLSDVDHVARGEREPSGDMCRYVDLAGGVE